MRNKIILKLLFFLFFFKFSFSSIQGVIFEVKDLSLFKEKIEDLDNNSFVLFDIDYTILTPKDASLKPCGKHLRRKYLHGLNLRLREYLQSIIALDGEEELMDNEFPSLTSQLQLQNIPVIGFTALETGKYGKIANLEDWRLDQLKKFNIDFSSSLSNQKSIIFNKCSSYNEHFPIFKNGVLFTNRLPKGDVLIVFLKKIKWNPNKILFVDDSLDQLKSVESVANSLGVEFIGFHYIAAKTNMADFDENLGEFQFRNLVKNRRWLPDNEAIKILAN